MLSCQQQLNFVLLFGSFFIVFVNSANLGQECQSDFECFGANQQCLPVGVPCGDIKICQCRQCYAEDNGQCRRSELLPPGNDYRDAKRCSVNNKWEVYPPGALCDAEIHYQVNGFVNCHPSTCYRQSNGRCEPLPKKNYASSCSADCECQSNLGCVSTCSCPQGESWDDDSLKCTKTKKNFGGKCSTTSDCNLAGASDSDYRSNGFTNYGGSCVNQQCTCATGYVMTETGFYNETNQQISTKTLCVKRGTSTDLGMGERCNIDPIGMSDVSNSRVCGAGLVCHACPGDSQSFMYGTCRRLVGQPDTCGRHNPPTQTSQSSGPKVKRIGQRCSEDYQCGFNERCGKPAFDPRMSHYIIFATHFDFPFFQQHVMKANVNVWVAME